MTPVTIIADLLRTIPEPVRKGLLIVFALCVVAEAVLSIAEVDLDYDKIDKILLYIGGYLGVQSAANVTAVPPANDDLASHDRDFPVL